MAIENPILGTQQISDMRRPDVGDPGAPYRALGKAVKTAVEVGGEAYRAKKVGELTGQLEEERQKYLDEQQGQLAAPDETSPEEDVFAFGPEPGPDEAELRAFTDKMLKLDKAKRAGTIGATELRIRQEKILREAMNAQPWLADEYIRAASRSQGYNPIGAQVAARAEMERDAATERRAATDRVINDMIQAGVPAYLLESNPVEFFRIGVQMTNSAMALQATKMAWEMVDYNDKNAARQAQMTFNKIIADGALASLPGHVQGFVSSWESAVASGAYSQSPEMQQMFEQRKVAMAREWQVGGTQYTKILKTLLEDNANLDLKGFQDLWKAHVDPFIKLVSESRNPEDARAATNFLVQAPVRNMMLDNPDLAITLDLAKAAAPFAAVPELSAFATDLSNTLVQQATPIWARAALRSPAGGMSWNPDATTPGVGTGKDIRGDAQAGERERRTFLASADQFFMGYRESKDQTSAERGVGMVMKTAQSLGYARNNSLSRPSDTFRNEFLGTVGSERFYDSMMGLPVNLRRNAAFEIANEVEAQTADIVTDISTDFSKREGVRWDQSQKVETTYANGMIRWKPREGLEGDRGAKLLSDQLNNQFSIEINRAFGAYANLARTDIAIKSLPDEMGQTYAQLVDSLLFKRGS